jgi:hypothetical protein
MPSRNLNNRRSRSVMKKIVLWAFLLGVTTSVVIGLAETYLPDASTKGCIIDALALPGAFIAGFYYTEGIHTGHGAPNWGGAVIALNFLVYVFFWLLVLTMARNYKKYRRRHDTGGAAVRRSGI